MKIDIKDLRVGSYLLKSLRSGNGRKRIVSISIDEFCRIANGDEVFNYEPVVLSEDVLVMAGFYQLPHKTIQNSFIIDIGRDRKVSVACVGTPNEMVFITDESDLENGSVVIVARNYDYDGKTYFHHLQAILWDLAKIEITL